jgi:hypothetical protein
MQDQANSLTQESLVTFYLHILFILKVGSILATIAWGFLEQRDKNGEQFDVWILAHDLPIREQPVENAITYQEFVANQHPFQNQEEEPIDIKQVHLDRAQMYADFCKQGNPGAKLRKYFDKMLKYLDLPKNAKNQLGISEEAKEEDKAPSKEKMSMDEFDREETQFKQLFQGGKYHILPSFFKTMATLKKQKREFAIVFRTFGYELENVISEFNR